ncbi:hypothetical protein C8Q76DRAFT_619310, partial [Earliella scabrosa]
MNSARVGNASSADLFSAATRKIDSFAKAAGFLASKSLIVPDAPPTLGGLETALLHFAQTAPKGALAVEGLVSFAHYASALKEDTLNAKVVDGVLSRLAPSIERLDALQRSIEERSQGIMEASTRIESLIADAREQAATDPGAPVPTPRPLTYAGAVAVQHVLPTSHQTVLDREKARTREVLVDGLVAPEGTSGFLAEDALVAKAETAVASLREDGVIVPAEVSFVSARRLRNGGVIFEMGDAVGAAWLRDHTHSELFAAKLGESTQIRPRAYKVVA